MGDGTTVDKSSPVQTGKYNNWKKISAGGNQTLAIRTDGTLWAWGNNYDGTYTPRTTPIQIGTDTTWSDIAVKSVHSLAIKTDGTLWAWGTNYEGELGDGTQGSKYTPVQIGTDNKWTMIAGGSGLHSLAIKSDGTLWAWGYNGYGQLGDNSTTNRLAPFQVGSGNTWIAVATGAYFTLAIKSDGTLWTWGDNGYGQLGISSTTAYKYPVKVGNDSNWTSVAAGNYHSLALKSDGRLWAWGYNYSGQLGDNTTVDKKFPVQVGSDSNWTHINCGSYFSIASKSDGSIWAWGYNAYGQLGDGTKIQRNYPVLISKNPTLKINNGAAATNLTSVTLDFIATDISGVAEMRFSNDNATWSDPEPYVTTKTWTISQGDGTKTVYVKFMDITGNWSDPFTSNIVLDTTPPTVTITSPAPAVTIYNTPLLTYSVSDGTVVVKVDGVVVPKVSGNTLDVLSNGSHTIRVEATDVVGNVGFAETSFTVDAVFPTVTISSPSSAVTNNKSPLLTYAVSNGSVVVKLDGVVTSKVSGDALPPLSDGPHTVRIEATDATGNVGFSNVTFTVDTTPPTVVPVSLQLSAKSHTLEVRSDGTLWAWGYNGYGQLGDTTYTTRTTPTQVGTGNIWAAVAAGYNHSIALNTAGTLWAWGDNGYGQLGDGTYTNRTTPTQLGTDTTWSAIAAGYYNTFAIKRDGTLWTWGNNGNGQLGDGTYTNRTTPTQVGTDTTWSAVAAGLYHTLAIKRDGTLWAWGYNYYGQLGNGTYNTRTTPTQVGTDTTWSAVAAGLYHTLAIKRDGTLWAWGYNYNGQLGDSTNYTRTTPTQVGTDTTWSAVAAGYYHSTAIKRDGTLWAWGYNYYGQLGDNTNFNRTTPTQVGTDTTWSVIAAGLYHTLAQKRDGTLWAWGYNSDGELGDGTTVNKTTPIAVTARTSSGNIITNLINNGARATDSTSVNLTLNATDANGVAEMQFSNDNVVWSDSEPYAPTKSWTLSAGDGTKTVYVRFKDVAGNWSIAYSSTIILDTVTPVVTITSPTAVLSHISTPLLSYTASEGTVVVKVDGSIVSKVSGNNLDTLVDGPHTVRVEATDLMGHVGFAEVSFTIDAPPVTTCAVNCTIGSDGWCTTPATVTLTSTDGNGASGADTTVYSFDNLTWQTYSQPFTVNGDGIHTVYYYSTDPGGNVETPPKSQQININQTGLVALWHLDNNGIDASHHGNDLTPHNVTFPSDALIGSNSASFNGSNTYLGVSSGNNLPLGAAPRTLMAWIKPFSYPDATYNGIVAYGPGACNQSSLLSIKNDGRLSMAFWCNDTYQTIGNPAVLNNWNQVAITYNGGTTVKFYMNGQFMQESALSGGYAANTQNGPVRIGTTDNPGRVFNGLIDEVSIYNRALTADEIQQNYLSNSLARPIVNNIPSPTASSTITLSGTKLANTSILVNGTELVSNNSSLNWQVSPYTLNPGVNNLQIQAKDATRTSQPVTVSVTWDNQSPVIASTVPANNALTNSGSGITVTLSDGATGSGVNLAASEAGALVKNGSTQVAGSWAVVGSALVFTPQTTPMADGAYTVTLNPVDAVGNTGTVSFGFTVDRTPPTVQTFSMNPVSPVKAGTVTFTLTFSEAMDNNTQPAVTLTGPSSRTLTGAWQVDGKTWQGTYAFTGATGDGSYNVAVSGAKDLAGNVMANQTGGTFVLDTVSPTVTLTSPTSGFVNNKTPQLTYTFSNGTVVVKVDGTVVNKTSGANLDNLADGTHTVTVQATDAAGNVGSASVTFTVDTTAPVIASSIPASNAYTNTASGITVTLADGATGSGANLAASEAGAQVKNGSTPVAGSWAVVGSALVFTPQTTPLADGAYTVTLNPVDTVGNTGTVSFGFTVDRTPPTVQTFSMNPVSPVKAGTVTFTLTFSKTMDRTVQPVVTFNGPSTHAMTGAWQADNKTWQGSYIFGTATGDGSYNVAVSGAKDLAGNVMVDQTGGTFVLDTVPPTVTLTSPTSGFGNNKTPQLAYTFSAGTVVVKVDGTVVNKTSGANLDNLADGTHTVTVLATDAAGNVGSASVTFTVDTNAPVVASSVPANSAVTNSASSISVTLGDGAGVDLQSSLAGAVVKDSSGAVVNGSWNVSGAALVFTPASSLADGTYTATLYPADLLGNKGSATLSFTLDRAPPTVQSLALSPSSPVKAGVVTFTLVFNEAMTATTSSQPVVTVTRPGVLFGTTSYAVTGGWQGATTWSGSYAFTTSSGDATYTVKVSGAKDLAQNTMADQQVGSFVLDTIPPATPAIGQFTNLTKVANQTLTGTKEANSALIINSVQRIPLNADITWSYTYPLIEGPNTLTITARDAAGNDSTPITPAPVITLDTTPPQFTIDTYKSPSPTVTQTIGGKKEPGCIVTLNGATIFNATDQNATWSYPVNLTDGLSNHLVFTAADALGNTTTKTLDILCDTAPPQSLAPGMLVALGSGKGTEVSLSWLNYSESADLGYYRIYYAGADFVSATGTPVGTVNKGTRTYKVTGLTQGTTYYFAVVPVSVSGNADSTVHTAYAVPTDTLPPEDVTALTATASYSVADGNIVNLSWTASVNSVGDLADQIVYMDAGQGYDAGTSLGKSVTTYTRKGFNDASVYKFKITTKDILGHESAGTIVQAATRLANPTGLAAVPASQKATLTWNAVSSPYFKSYNIYRLVSTTPQSDVSTMPMLLVKNQTGTSFTDTGLANDTTYQYAVTVVNTSGAERTSVQSVPATPRADTTGPVISGVSLTANQVIAAPISITATAQDAESSMGRIELYIDNTLATSVNGGSLSYAWNVVNTTDGNHTVKIDAYDSVGNLTEQAIPVVVSLAPPPTPVITSTFGAPINQKTTAISGTAQAGSTVSLRVNGVVVAQQTTSAAALTFTGVVLAEGDNFVAAKAGNRGGDSSFTSDTKVTVVTTAPSAPVGLTAKALAGGSVQFTWQAGASGAPVGYNLYEVPATFTALTDPGVKKTNTAPIAYLLKEYIPADDTTRSYVVTAVDGAGNESPASNLLTIASDRLAPTSAVGFTDASGATPADNTYGPGTVQVAVRVSEALSEAPFFSIVPPNASPIVVSLRLVDATHYTGSFSIDATSPYGSTTWNFSGKDLVGNRGTSQGTGPVIDNRGPIASIIAPVTMLKTTAGPAAVSLSLDEASTTVPVLTLKAADGSTAQATALASADNGVHWGGTIDPTALGEGTAQFSISGTQDRFGNKGTTVKVGAAILLYKNLPPAPAVPTGLAAKAGRGGSVTLSWTKVTDAQGYNVYRQGAADVAPLLITGIATGTTTSYTDTPPTDGSYAYSVSSLGLLNVESAQSGQVTVTSDATPPAVPTGLSLTMTANGVQAVWDAVTAPAVVPASYHLYRAAASFTNISGLNPVVTANSNSVTDPAPVTSQRYYAVTALDGLGNESAPSPAQEITFPVAPVSNLLLTLIDNGKPNLSWSPGEAGVQGFYIYRNGDKINQTPTSSISYEDGYYAGGSITYGVSAVDANGTESPVKTVTLPLVTVALKDGTTMHRGLLENVALMATLPSDATNNLTIDAVSVKIGTLPESTENGPFTIIAGTPLEIDKVAATEATAPTQEAVVVTAIMHPSPGTTVKLTRNLLTAVLASGTAMEIFNDPLVRGTQGSVRIKVNNLGSARTEFLTSENGGPTSHVTVYLKDQDGNLLAQGNLNQQTGSVVNSGSYTTARLEPGDSFLSDPIVFNIPSTAPYKVSLVAVIDNTYYHYTEADQVVAPGLSQSEDAIIADVSYLASAATNKTVYKQGESVVISGQATSTTNGQPMPLVPVKIGVSVNGFDRFFTVNTDANGSFSYTFTPGSNEAGSYSVWATHPDLSDRTVQAQFSIIGLSVTPAVANVTMLKGGQQVDIPINLTNLGGTPLTQLTLIPTASSGITATVVSPGADTLAAGEKRTVTLHLAATATAPDSGFASLAVATNEGLTGRVDANISLVSAIPLITTAPSYIDTGLVRGTQRIVNFTVTNSGYGILLNPRIEGPSLPWLSLAIDKNIGDCLDSACATRGIIAGQSKTVGIMINPTDTVPQGVYNDRLVIYSDNHIPYTYNVQVTVTSNAVGSVQFSVLDELMKQVGGASITLQNQSVTELIYNLTTASDGTVSLTDIPEGRYSYNITAAGHNPYGGSFVITPGVWTTVPVGLEVNLVQIELSVTQTTIQDQYQITINQTFATNVPAPVLVTEPPNINLPDMLPGQVFNGEFTVTNYGLIAVDNPQINFPTSFGNYDVEMLNLMPKRIEAMQKIIVPYRITRRQTVASLGAIINPDALVATLCSEVGGFGGGSCVTWVTFYVTGTAVICPNTPQQRTVEVKTPFTVGIPLDFCPSGTPAGSLVSGGGGGGTSTSTGGGAAGGQSGGGGLPGGSPTPIKTSNPCDCKPDNTPCPGPGGECWKDVCLGGTCTHTPDDTQTPANSCLKCSSGLIEEVSYGSLGSDNSSCCFFGDAVPNAPVTAGNLSKCQNNLKQKLGHIDTSNGCGPDGLFGHIYPIPNNPMWWFQQNNPYYTVTHSQSDSSFFTPCNQHDFCYCSAPGNLDTR